MLLPIVLILLLLAIIALSFIAGVATVTHKILAAEEMPLARNMSFWSAVGAGVALFASVGISSLIIYLHFIGH